MESITDSNTNTVFILLSDGNGCFEEPTSEDTWIRHSVVFLILESWRHLDSLGSCRADGDENIPGQ